ncbi:hypothetical protein L208DRAFT_1541759 [Tricholoma matsutake]|nr:hypothetical protein L208DRAFT_1541759 [Tricholoma matsutake 945]
MISCFPQKSVKHNPIYHFYEPWEVNSEGNTGNPGDSHYRCHHGTHKIFIITKASNHNLHSKFLYCSAMHNLYLVMKGRETPTADEILMASGKKTFDNSLQAEYLKIIEEQASGIKEAFMKQQAKAAEPWDQEKFERLLIEWMVACDQPFEEVEKPEFIVTMSYGRTGKFMLPKWDGI